MPEHRVGEMMDQRPIEQSAVAEQWPLAARAAAACDTALMVAGDVAVMRLEAWSLLAECRALRESLARYRVRSDERHTESP